jgi:hypothetical protein
MAGSGSPMVRIIKNKDAATWRMIDAAKLTLVAMPQTESDAPRLIPERGILD